MDDISPTEQLHTTDSRSRQYGLEPAPFYLCGMYKASQSAWCFGRTTGRYGGWDDRRRFKLITKTCKSHSRMAVVKRDAGGRRLLAHALLAMQLCSQWQHCGDRIVYNITYFVYDMYYNISMINYSTYNIKTNKHIDMYYIVYNILYK